MDGGVIVKRYRGGDDKCCLSILSPEDLSPKVVRENLNLPPHIQDDEIDCNKCGEFLLLDDFEGNLALYNLNSKELKLLPPPHLDTPKDTVVFGGTGLGYDHKSDDYKVVRDLTEWYCDEYDDVTGTRRLTEVYSLKSGSWKEIPSPAAHIESYNGVYVSGRCYWKGSPYSNSVSRFHIVSFDFTKESFYCLETPPPSEGLDILFNLVECRGSLGVIGYERSGTSKSFVLWMREGRSWLKLFDTVVDGVERPLGLKDGRFLFLEGLTSSEKLRQLLVYDCMTKVVKKLDIYDYQRQMKVISYADTLPMHRRSKRGLKRRRKVMKKNRTRKRKRDNAHSA